LTIRLPPDHPPCNAAQLAGAGPAWPAGQPEGSQLRIRDGMECSVDAVDRKGDAVTESLQLTKSKTEHRRGVLEQAAALPRNDRIDEEPVLVDESEPDQLVNEGNAACSNDVLAGAALQSRDLFVEISMQDGRVLLSRVLHGGGHHELVDAVEIIGVACCVVALPGPEGPHVLE
jgi:hypothetical protein